MKLWVLTENTAACGFGAEHGLSLYLEVNGRRILFDMGQSLLFAENAEKLRVDLAAVDTAVLSHGHYDHGGGIEAFFQRNNSAKLFINHHAFEAHYNGSGKYIGLDPVLRSNPRLVFTEDTYSLGDGLSLHSCNECLRTWEIAPRGLAMEQGGSLQPEDFRHEQYLLVEETGKRILITGCSHKGIVNLAKQFRPHVLVGGFHLKDVAADSPEIDAVAQALLEQETVYYTGHCTGEAQFARLKALMGERLHGISSGTVLEI